ncbi:arginine--tRNA ligase [Trichlorobacter ammonificans]|uniref:Arginine--tRNA ligase n=1 Tax=Trichlorobacter ammonificans TaxID=2916410 RepID=A0ABM9D8J1_9BACT|nr:arginine--tRNA ligase [Trichlorobacter ammonificans]CAH2030861.1 Arginine--tRNA ligase [Trichlorobacter ammonificans]
MIRQKLVQLVTAALDKAHATGLLSSEAFPPVVIGIPAVETHGDFSCNIAMQLAKPERKAPRQVAEIILASLDDQEHLVAGTEIAGPGFINFFIAPTAWQSCLPAMAAAGAAYGRTDRYAGTKMQVEFVSANPTGPLHIGHGRGAAIGDVLCRLFAATGMEVVREFYYNDAGAQISNLALSVQSRCLGIEPDDPRWPADGYQGEYIKEVAVAYLAGETVTADDRQVTAAADPDDLEAIRRFAVAWLRREQDEDLKAFDVRFDNYFLESSLYSDGKVDAAVATLIGSGHTYEQDGALWLRTTDFGDDKDRVMRKTDGSYTYFVPDVAYHLDKWRRGFSRVVNEQGADHHSTITRVRAGLQALNAGIPTGWPEYVLHQMVTVLRGGQEVKISKRAGSYVTLRDLIDEVGRDAVRFFFVMRKPDSQLVFDIDLAKQQSLDNPVYYIQYAHARICSIFLNAAEKGILPPTAPDVAQLARLETAEEMKLIKLLDALPDTVEEAARDFEPHRLVYYLTDLAGRFHSYYNKTKVVTDDRTTSEARLYLLSVTRQVLRNALGLLGVSAPDEM